MKNPLSLSKFLSSKQSSSSGPPSSITDAADTKWREVGKAEDHLLQELTNLYWIGVESELESVLLALRAWKSPKKGSDDQGEDGDEDEDDFIHGFDTFIDQVGEDGHFLAEKVGQLKKRIVPTAHLQALAQSAEVGIAEQRSAELKQEIRDAVAEAGPKELPDRRRARLLLQSLGLLDIEKLVEHRPPLDGFSFWKRPSVPQLKLETLGQSQMPVLQPLLCSKCEITISGSMYCRQTENKEEKRESVEHVCEDCYLRYYLGGSGSDGFMKQYKHCILSEIINPRLSRKICMCDDVSHYDSQGRSMTLFPVDKTHNHRKATVPGGVECGLLKLGGIVAEAKYEGMQRITSRNKPDKKAKRNKDEKASKETKVKTTERPRAVTKESQQASDRDGTTEMTVAFEEAEADEDIPFLIRQYAERYPFGNVHMALRAGPLIIENGVKQ